MRYYKISIEERDRLVAAEHSESNYGDMRIALADGVSYPSDFATISSDETYYEIEDNAVEWARRAGFTVAVLDD